MTVGRIDRVQMETIIGPSFKTINGIQEKALRAGVWDLQGR